MIIKDFQPFIGEHCETTTTGSLLKHIGIHLSEPMLFGIGQGLGYIYWNMKMMDFPFIGGRIKPDLLTQNICQNLNLTLEVKETLSTRKAWSTVKDSLDKGIPVGLKLDCYHLEYFASKIHFAGHYASIYGYDELYAYLNDTNQQGRNAVTSLKSLALARNEKGPMSSKNLSYTISKTVDIASLKKVIPKAIHNNASDFLNPPIKNIGYKGIAKTSLEVKKWFQSSTSIKKDFQLCASLMEGGGTGGSLFRNLYKNFLKESANVLDSSELLEASESYSKIASMWKRVSDLLHLIGDTENIIYIEEVSNILLELSAKEEQTMKSLQKITAKLL
ncbi:Butirosin biosynthesis protein H, N-terminal [Tenacibaculum sp. MAR_2009_124]|uniref:BtrH N-terminal domain-containing protein n=1 Tax=Tenacibaculum sp. MAR_2009_124 TaxID=1250059 RepID=UPI000894DBC1|nr:BtrH N-terminal domain-containing protein [Tenacibaculum sp. MAR_2009_124]SEB36986.1 Butirosin biosynthesis protein H, N-terminal [Tenacibaculum sp. MAR_2009_124]